VTRLLLLVVACTACSSKGGEAPAAPPVLGPLQAGYEALRARLSDDDLAGARSAAEALAGAGAAGEAALKDPALAVAKTSEIEAARLSFGELSKAYLTWLAAEPERGKGLHAFRCPMAQGYKKWVQVDSAMKNPYMGKRMLECGSEVALAP